MIEFKINNEVIKGTNEDVESWFKGLGIRQWRVTVIWRCQTTPLDPLDFLSLCMEGMDNLTLISFYWLTIT